ncbi:MAG: hypothetical protein ACYTG0_00895 [Planctomycetota bacterium]|jgi:hypothetical protein
MVEQRRRLQHSLRCLAGLIGLGLLVATPAGCRRADYRRRADEEVYGLVYDASRDPRWPLENYTIQPDPRSRFYDPYNPDCPPMPPDDPTAHQLMHYVDGKRGGEWDKQYGRTPYVENPVWAQYLPRDENGMVVVDRDGAVEIALIHSREYQVQLEDLYLLALEVSLERFRFDCQFFGGNTTTFDLGGSLLGKGVDFSSLRNSTPIGFNRLFATGGQLAVEVANSIVWNFTAPDGRVTVTPLSFTLFQPLLRNAGRAVVLEGLTDSERALLAEVRSLERFRREFYILVTDPYLGLLQQQVEIRNQERNVVALKDSLRQLELSFDLDPAGGTQADSVESARQNLYVSQSSLVGSRVRYDTSVDTYLITLGLPPDLPVRTDDPTLNRFNLIDPAMTSLQDRVDAIRDFLSDPDQPMPQDHQARTAALRRECEAQLAAVAEDLQLLLDALPNRRETLRRLSAREEFQRGDVDPTLVDVDEFDKRVVRLHVDYYGPGNPLVGQVAAGLLTTADQQQWLQKVEAARRDGGIEGAFVELRGTLASLEAFEQNPQAATDAFNAQRLDDEQIEPKKRLANLFTDLWRQLVGLSVIQARARLDAIPLVPLDLDPVDALEIARENRRDWMNARADLVDSWRQIELAANDLESNLDVVLDGDLTTRNNTTPPLDSTTPLAISRRGSNSTHRWPAWPSGTPTAGP